MDSVDPAQTPSLSRINSLAPFIVGLVVAAAVAFSASSPPSHYLSWTELLGSAVERVFFVSLACVMAAAFIFAVTSRTSKLDSSILARNSRAAIWLAPLALFIRANSLWTIAIAATFAVIVTPSFRAAEEPSSDPEDSLLFSLRPDEIPLSSKFRPQVCVAAALCAQIGTLAALGGHSLAGAIVVGIAFAALTWSMPRWPSNNSQPVAPRDLQTRSLLVDLMAVVVTIAGLIPYVRGSSGFGLLGSSHKHPAHGIADGGGTSHHSARLQVADNPGTSASEGNAGIVLWPMNQVETKLVAPTPIDLTQNRAYGRDTDPLVIPFNGVYWFFKAPDLRPPKSSRQAQASPDAVDIRSTDRRPLSIEAHDHLGSLIDLNCCSRIKVAIRNADRYPETVSLELVLTDTSRPNEPSESLGRMMVRSTRPWGIYDQQHNPVSETLNFVIPPRGTLRCFDEVKIIFRLDRARADSGARIAIDHFVLVPRGL